MGSGTSRAYPSVLSIATSVGQKDRVKTKRRYIHGMNPDKFWVEKVLPNLRQTSLLDLLHISEIEAQAIFLTFVDMDADNSGEIELLEFHYFLEIPMTKFSERIFLKFDMDGDGSLVFQELLAGLWNYCTFELTNIFHYFSNKMKRMLNGTENADPSVLRMLAVNGDETDEAKMTFEEFFKISKKNAQVLSPAIKLQQILRRKLGGEAFWEHQTRVRMMEVVKEGHATLSVNSNNPQDLIKWDYVEMALRKN